MQHVYKPYAGFKCIISVCKKKRNVNALYNIFNYTLVFVRFCLLTFVVSKCNRIKLIKNRTFFPSNFRSAFHRSSCTFVSEQQRPSGSDMGKRTYRSFSLFSIYIYFYYYYRGFSCRFTLWTAAYSIQ